MFTGMVEEKLMVVTQKIEQRVVLPPGIGWHLSNPTTSGSQPSESAYNVVIQPSSDLILLVDNVFDHRVI